MPVLKASLKEYFTKSIFRISSYISRRIFDIQNSADFITGPDCVPGQADVSAAVRFLHRLKFEKLAQTED